MSNFQFVLAAPSRAELVEKLDAFLAEGKPFKDIPLILPATGTSHRETYKGFTVRYWRDAQTGVDRYDTGIQLIDTPPAATLGAPDPATLLAELGDGLFTLKGAGVFWPYSELQYRAIGLTADGKGIALEIVNDARQ